MLDKIGELKKILAYAKFMVLPLPYFKYSFGQMTLLQAMSMQKAVIVTKVPGVEGHVEEGKNAIFFKPRDWQDLKNKMEALLRDTKSNERIAQNGFLACLKNFTWS